YLGDPDIDFVKLAESQGVKGEKVGTAADLEAALKRGVQSTRNGNSYLVEAVISRIGGGAESTWHEGFKLTQRMKGRRAGCENSIRRGARRCSARALPRTRRCVSGRLAKDRRWEFVGLGGLGHMGLKFAKAFGAHVALFTTSPKKSADAVRLGADEVIVSTDSAAMQKHAA